MSAGLCVFYVHLSCSLTSNKCFFYSFATTFLAFLAFVVLGNRFKNGKVVIVLSGRYAGRKAIVVKASDDGNAEKRYGHALVAGIDRYPKKVVKAMKKSKQDKKMKIKPFVKSLNYNHIMPTRYSVDFDLKKEDVKTSRDAIVDTKKELKKLFEDKFKTQKDPKGDRKAAGAGYFFQKLRF